MLKKEIACSISGNIFFKILSKKGARLIENYPSMSEIVTLHLQGNDRIFKIKKIRAEHHQLNTRFSRSKIFLAASVMAGIALGVVNFYIDSQLLSLLSKQAGFILLGMNIHLLWNSKSSLKSLKRFAEHMRGIFQANRKQEQERIQFLLNRLN